MKPPAQNYRYEFIDGDKFWPMFHHYRDLIFGDRATADVNLFYSEEEKEKNKLLAGNMAQCTALNLVAYDGDKLIGWSAGDQSGKSQYYMRNSAVLPEYRQQGIYTHMLKLTLDKLVELGYQEVYSRHHPTNNSVLIAKLKAGFVIGGIEMTDVFGTLITLKYFPNKDRLNLFSHRVGGSKGDIKSYGSMGLNLPEPI